MNAELDKTYKRIEKHLKILEKEGNFEPGSEREEEFKELCEGARLLKILIYGEE